MLEKMRKLWGTYGPYERFERVSLRFIQFLLALITVYAIALVCMTLFRDATLGAGFMDKSVLQDTFGSILTILILLEFNHSVQVAISQRTGAVQVRIVVLIALLVVSRKLMLLDYAAVGIQTLLGFAALLVALATAYWLITRGDAHRG